MFLIALFSSSLVFLLITLTIYSIIIIFFCGTTYISSFYYNLKGISVLIKDTNRKIDTDSFHDAIIVTHYKFSLKLLSYELGIHDLVGHFQQNNRSYIIYNCYEPNDFKKVVNNPKAKNLWIFGHGTRSLLNFGPGINQEYIELSNAPKKGFVGQFHCNGFDDPTEKSLADLIAFYGYVTKGETTAVEIRQAIEVLIDIKINKQNEPLQ
jgi:hypothetical protein